MFSSTVSSGDAGDPLLTCAMHRRFALLLLVLVISIMTGCLEVHQQFTINPDRSAKVRVKLAFNLELLERVEAETGIDMKNEAHEAEATMRNLARQCIATATGVDAWTDYSMEIRPRESITVWMTAYVPEVTHFKLNPNNGDIPNMTLRVARNTGSEETWSVILPGLNDRKPSEKEPLQALNREELAEVPQERRTQFDEESAESKVLFESLKITSAMRFPGKVTKTSNATRTSPQEATVSFEGKRFYAMMEKILADDQLAPKAFRNGAELHSSLTLPGDQINAWLFGEKAPVSVTVAPGVRALFDYEKELAAAKASPPPEFPEDE